MMLALVDCNSFYVSCERIFNPFLWGKAVVVLSNNDGCVISRSEEAKALGIKMGEPIFKIKALLEENDVQVYSSNYVLYGDISRRVMTTLAQFSPALEIYSIDEAFLDLSAFNLDLEEYGQKIKRKIFKDTGMPVCLGIAPTKALAKLANRWAKKDKNNQGVLVLAREEEIERTLKMTQVGDVWGIGRQYNKLLYSYGVRTAWDFLNLPDNWVQKKMTIVGLALKKELAGQSYFDMELKERVKKNICTSRSFGLAVEELAVLKEALANYASSCALKLRQQGSCAREIKVFIHTNSFNVNEAQYAKSTLVKLPVATNSTLELTKYALSALELIYQPGYRYKKAGVIVGDIVPQERVQGSLFDLVERDKESQVMEVMDKLNKRYGKNTLKLASLGNGQQWKARQENLSPCYTTRWSDIINVKG